jgi:hypothetical protein
LLPQYSLGRNIRLWLSFYVSRREEFSIASQIKRKLFSPGDPAAQRLFKRLNMALDLSLSLYARLDGGCAKIGASGRERKPLCGRVSTRVMPRSA